MAEDKQQNFLAFFFPVAGSLLIWFNWNMAHTDGHYLTELAVAGPMVLVIGLYLLVFPDDLSMIDGKIKTRFWIAIIFALLMGIANIYATENGLY